MKPRYTILVLALFGSGCWTTKDQGQALQRDVNVLKRKLTTDIQRSEEERAKLQKVMEQATALLTHNSADVGAQMDRLQARVDELQGQVEEQDKKINDVNQQLAKIEVKLDGLSSGAPQPQAPPVPDDKDELFKLAQHKLGAGEHEEARRLTRHFISRFPADSRMGHAQLMLGDSYFAEQKFAPAIVEYKKILDQHKKSAVYPDALYKVGMAFYQLKFCGDAQLFLNQLIKHYKRHPQAARARKVLGLIRRYRRNPNFCRP